MGNARDAEALRALSVDRLRDFGSYPVFPEALPDASLDDGKYSVRFARTGAELAEVQRLRFEVFNLELGEGLDESYETGLDEDRFDPVCHHLIVIDRSSERIVGTYRMLTSTMAETYEGFYSAGEFDLDALPPSVVGDAIEIGRACIATEYRNRHVLFLLWKGLALYLTHNRKRYLFGCCSLTSQDPVEGSRVMAHLESNDLAHPTLRLKTQPGWECEAPADADLAAGPAVKLPKLFRLYLRYGARVCSEPALDRHFKTIDYLVLFDLEDLDAGSRATFFR